MTDREFDKESAEMMRAGLKEVRRFQRQQRKEWLRFLRLMKNPKTRIIFNAPCKS